MFSEQWVSTSSQSWCHTCWRCAFSTTYFKINCKGLFSLLNLREVLDFSNSHFAQSSTVILYKHSACVNFLRDCTCKEFAFWPGAQILYVQSYHDSTQCNYNWQVFAFLLMKHFDASTFILSAHKFDNRLFANTPFYFLNCCFEHVECPSANAYRPCICSAGFCSTKSQADGFRTWLHGLSSSWTRLSKSSFVNEGATGWHHFLWAHRETNVSLL